MTRRFRRRQFLRGSSGLLALPFLPSALARQARAQESDGPPKRLVIFFHPNGVRPQHWFPTDVSPDDDSQFTLSRCLQPLTPHRDKVLITSGIDMASLALGPGEPHQRGMGGVLSGIHLQDGDFVGGDGSRAGWGGGISVDQRIVQATGGDTPFPSLQLGVRPDAPAAGGEVRNRLSYLGPGQPLPPEKEPWAVFDRLFSQQTISDTANRELMRFKRGSVLDVVHQDLARLQSQRLDSQDRAKLDAHLTHLRALEQQVTAAQQRACEMPARPPEHDLLDEDTIPIRTQQMIDLISLSFACDLTRVVCLQNSNAQNHTRMPWIDAFGDGHALSHASDSSLNSVDEWANRDTWFASQFASLLSALDAIDEGGTSVLDNTLVLWVNELSKGNTHSHINMPFVLAGGLGLRGGRMVQFNNASHNDLLLAVLRAFAIDDATIGNPDFCTGPLTGLF